MKGIPIRNRWLLVVLLTLVGAVLVEALPQGKGGWLSRQRQDPDFGKPMPAQTPEWAEDGWGVSLAKLFPPWEKRAPEPDGRFYLPARAFDPVLRGSMARPGAFPEEARLVGTPWTSGRVDRIREETEDGEDTEETSPVLETPQPHSLSGFLAHLEATRRAEEAARKAREERTRQEDSEAGEEKSADGEGGGKQANGDPGGAEPGTRGTEGAQQRASGGQAGERGITTRTTVGGEPIFPRPGSRRLLDERILMYFPVDAGGEQEVNVVLPGDALPRFQPPYSGMRSSATIREEP